VRPACRYLGGVLDFTGELNRHAVACATRRDVAAVSRCREIVDSLMGQFLQFGEPFLKLMPQMSSKQTCRAYAGGKVHL
jgi:predicted translin family RNA/ssDNA-binding protein